jgi:hypothetical protein
MVRKDVRARLKAGRKPGRDQFAQEPEQRIALNTNRVRVQY